MVKRVVIVLLISLVVLSPLIVLSTPSLNLVQSIIDRNKEAPSAPGWQLFLARLFQKTFRENAGAEAYKTFMERYQKDPRFPEAKFGYAVCLSDDKSKKSEAVKEFEEFMEWYPEHALRPDAEKKRNALLYGY